MSNKAFCTVCAKCLVTHCVSFRHQNCQIHYK